MKPYLLRLIGRRSVEGMTLVELLTVLVIIGILSSLAIPSFLSQVAKARHAEAKSHISTINRFQQSYRTTHTEFATDIDSLGAGIPSQTSSYDYSISPQGALQSRQTVANAATQDAALNAYAGAVVLFEPGDTVAVTSEMCESDSPGVRPPIPTMDTAATTADAAITCPPGSSSLQ